MKPDRFYLSSFSAPQILLTLLYSVLLQTNPVSCRKKSFMSFLVFKESSLALSPKAVFSNYQLILVGFAGMPSNFSNVIYVMRGPLFVWELQLYVLLKSHSLTYTQFPIVFHKVINYLRLHCWKQHCIWKMFQISLLVYSQSFLFILSNGLP